MNQNEYITSSLSLAAAIPLASKSKLQYIRMSQESGRATFVFNQTEDLPDVIKLFWEKSLCLDALSYFESLKQIKSRLYEEGH